MTEISDLYKFIRTIVLCEMKTVLYLTLVAGVAFDVVAGMYLWNLTRAPKPSTASVRADVTTPLQSTNQQTAHSRPASPVYSRF
jgi:hypothetical protein